MRTVKIITDSASDLPPRFYKDYDISMLPMGVTFDDKTYLDVVELDKKTFFSMMKENTDSMPKTSMPPVAIMDAEFRKNLDAYEHQIFVSISSKGSGTYNFANIVKNQIEESIGKKSNITVIDSLSYSIGYGIAVVDMARAAYGGAGFDEVMRVYNETRGKIHVSLIVDDLMHLQRGGRINPAVAVVGGMLGIKPLLTIADGIIDSCGKERGKSRAMDKIIDEMIGRIGNSDEKRIWLIHADAAEDVLLLKDAICERITPTELIICDMGACVGVHTGRGLLGLVYTA